MIPPHTVWQLKTYFLCFIILLFSFSAFAGAEHLKSGHLKWAKNADFKPFYRAFTKPDMQRYVKFCENPRYKRLEYLDNKRKLANDNDIKASFQYGAIAVYAPCSLINKGVGKSYLRNAANAGSVEALYLLGLAESSHNNAMMQKAAKSGHAHAAYNLAISKQSEKDIYTSDKYYLYAIEGDIPRAKHDYALFLLKNMRFFKEAKLHYAHNLLKQVMIEKENTPLAGHAAYNIFLLQQRYPQIIYGHADTKKLFNIANKYGLIAKVKTNRKKTYVQKVALVSPPKAIHKTTSETSHIKSDILWENQEIKAFGNNLY